MNKKNYTIAKTLILSALSICSILEISAQTADTVTMSPGYTRQVFYKMGVGEAGSTLVSNWDIAHNSNTRDNALRLNHMNGLVAYLYPKGDNTAWSSFDTSGSYTWPGLYNSLDKMHVGAFNQSVDKSNMWDFGWGVYNSGSHTVQGDSIYLLLKRNGSGAITNAYKFMPIEQKTNGDFIFKIADVNGSNEYQDTLFQKDANSQHFKYFTLGTKARNVREPGKTDWDFTFTRYYAPAYNPGTQKFEMYPTMGVESNLTTKVAEVDGKSFSQYSADDIHHLARTHYTSLSNNFTEIGSDWKTFNSTTNSFDVNSNKLFVMETRDAQNDSAYYVLWFTRFVGSASGEIEFNYKKLDNTISASHPSIGTVSVFPNPSSIGNIIVTIQSTNTNALNLNLLNLEGKVVASKVIESAIFSATSLNTTNLPAGVYILNINNGKTSSNQKVIID